MGQKVNVGKSKCAFILYTGTVIVNYVFIPLLIFFMPSWKPN